MIKKKIFFFFLIFLINQKIVFAETYKIIAIINNEAVTNQDIKNEIEVIKILNKNKIDQKIIFTKALQSIIEEKIKYQEIINYKKDIDNEKTNRFYKIFLQNSNLDENQLNVKYSEILKKKIKIDYNWNELIRDKYSWKININMHEVEKKIKKFEKNEKNKSLSEIKNELLEEEKLKKLKVFEKYHLNRLKQKSHIVIYK